MSIKVNLIYSRIFTPLFYLVQASIVLVIAFFSLHLHSYDMRVPFSYSGDSVVILMYIKGLIQDGWPTTISHLSAPFTYSGAAFPILTSVDWLIIKILSIFTNEPGALLNGFWLQTLVFSAWSATYAAYQLGLSRILSFLSGVLYAFLPFALLRNVAHLNLVYYFVPLLCLLAVIIAGSGVGIRQLKQATIVGLIACILQGFNYIYYSFFAVLLFCVAALISYKGQARIRQLKLPLIAITLILLSTAINMVPAIQSWEKNGVPPEMDYKSLTDSEVYGAKLRRMLSPHPDNLASPLATVAQRALKADYLYENENVTARMGLYGAIGLLMIIYFSIRRDQESDLLQPNAAITSLGIATLLIITVGGFGAIINLLTVPDIRAYNRFSVYLAFFGIVTTSLWLQNRFNNNFRCKEVGYCIAAFFVLFSLYDQLLDIKGLVNSQKNDITLANKEKLVVKKLESILQKNSAVLELPFTGFPPLAIFNKMDSYDHGRPFLWSHHLKWSWPSFSQRHRAWQTKMSSLKGNDLINAAIYSGFSAIWIDRFAYLDNGQELISSLKIGRVKEVDLDSNRFVVLDIRDAATDLKSSLSISEFMKNKSEIFGNGFSIGWQRGFYDEEKNPEGQNFRWVNDKAILSIRNYRESPLNVCVEFSIASPSIGQVKIDGFKAPLVINTSTTPKLIRLPLTLEPGDAKDVKFSTDLGRLIALEDKRELYFTIINFSTKILNDSIKCGAD